MRISSSLCVLLTTFEPVSTMFVRIVQVSWKFTAWGKTGTWFVAPARIRQAPVTLYQTLENPCWGETLFISQLWEKRKLALLFNQKVQARDTHPQETWCHSLCCSWNNLFLLTSLVEDISKDDISSINTVVSSTHQLMTLSRAKQAF